VLLHHIQLATILRCYNRINVEEEYNQQTLESSPNMELFQKQNRNSRTHQGDRNNLQVAAGHKRCIKTQQALRIPRRSARLGKEQGPPTESASSVELEAATKRDRQTVRTGAGAGPVGNCFPNRQSACSLGTALGSLRK
jgi:hypothetical protein